MHSHAFTTQRVQFRVAATVRRPRSIRLCVSNKLVLTPTGSGKTDHIGEAVSLPGTIVLKEGLFEIGRTSPADIVVPIPTVSTRHAVVRVTDASGAAAGSVQVTDLGSTNGTFVDGKELKAMEAVPLKVGGEVIFGDANLAAFRLDLLPDSLPAAPAGTKDPLEEKRVDDCEVDPSQPECRVYDD